MHAFCNRDSGGCVCTWCSMGKAQADGLESAPVKGRQSRDLRNGFEMAELTGGGASGARTTVEGGHCHRNLDI